MHSETIIEAIKLHIRHVTLIKHGLTLVVVHIHALIDHVLDIVASDSHHLRLELLVEAVTILTTKGSRAFVKTATQRAIDSFFSSTFHS